MALGALRGRVAIYADGFAGNFPPVLVALGAGHVAMHAAEHKPGSVVTEIVSFPPRHDVTGGTILHSGRAEELTVMRFLGAMAPEALRRCIREPRRSRRAFARGWIGRLVALNALHVLVSALDPEARRRVVERSRRLPLFGRVAGLAREPGLVRVGVTRAAGPGSEMIIPRDGRGGAVPGGGERRGGAAGRGERLVALVAGHSGVLSGESKPGRRVAIDRERRRLEAPDGVALAALVQVGGGRELAAVPVDMASGASQLAGDVHRALALRLVALRAAEVQVFALERERALAVRLAVEASGFEAGLGMTRRAVGAGRAFGELPAVPVLMAIAATLMRNRAVEIGGLVALGAG